MSDPQKLTWETERQWICELFMENVFDISELLREVQTARAGIKRKGQKAMVGAGSLDRIESALIRLQRVEDLLRDTSRRNNAATAAYELAKKAYQDPKTDYRKRMAKVARALGLSTGKAEPRYNSNAMFADYRTLIDCGCLATEPPPDGWKFKPIEKWMAVALLTKHYKRPSYDATLQALRREKKKKERAGCKFPIGFLPGPQYIPKF